MIGSWAKRSRERTEADVQQDIERAKKAASEAVDAAWLDRHSYCLTNIILNIEKEIPVLEHQAKSMENMVEKVRDTPEWIMERAFLSDRLESYKKSLVDGKTEIESIKEQLKEYRFKQDKVEYDLELEAIKVRAKEAEEKKLKDADKPEEDLKLG